MKQTLKFPKGFLWGAAGSAYQTEGNNTHSDWWAFEHSLKRIEYTKTRGRNPEQYKSGIACDFWHRFEHDFYLAEHLGHNANRFGVEWARIEPREGEFDESALDHYEKILQSAKFHRLEVFLTLHHYTLPIWLAKKGGFSKRENMEYYFRFVQKVSRRLGEYVDYWITFNEPEVYSTYSFFFGVFPPQQRSLWKTIKVVGNIIYAHNIAAGILKKETGKPVSMAFQLADLQAASRLGSLTKTLSHYLANEYILRRVVGNCDFIGVNYYNHHHIGLFGFRKHSHSQHQVTDLGWGIHPDGLERVLLEVQNYGKPIYITENGLADGRDEKREKYIKDHLYYVHQAIQKGADVRGYLHWSLTDNFEWQHGFWPRFGLIEIDREDFLRRKVRYSAIKYAEICKTNTLEYDS